MRTKVTGFILCFALFVSLLAVACSYSMSNSSSHPPPEPSPTNPILQFYLFVNTGGHPPGGYIPGIPFVTMPFPTDFPEVSPGQYIYVFIMENTSFLGDRTLSKMTLTNKNTGTEFPLISPPGISQSNPNLPDSFVAPNEAGIYEIDLYYKDSVVASESFQVTS